MTNRHLAAALAAAARGWPVFPLLVGRKQPLWEDWEANATTDPGRIRGWWSQPGHDRNGVGIACGPAGLLVIDCDQPKPKDPPPTEPGICDGADALAALADHAGGVLPLDTYTVQTPSGGIHLYYRAPAGNRLGNTQRSLGWLLDTRGQVGLVVAAGTRHGAGVYRAVHDAPAAPLPDWIADRLTKPAYVPAEPTEAAVGHLSAYLAAIVDGEMRRVADAPAGAHNLELFKASINLGRLVAGGELTHQTAYDALRSAELIMRGRCGKSDHTDRQAHNTILSGFRTGATDPRTLGRAAA
ncbi:bifunctional DNA primase/polymerase [Microlunatus sp. GCM10028923]|uniref:bifunctional DNA primase/polymerase n=1 Tax=Microlunatus sp. GCM10028923 TaxID=3273400 RepID=UPI0036132EF2